MCVLYKQYKKLILLPREWPQKLITVRPTSLQQSQSLKNINYSPS